MRVEAVVLAAGESRRMGRTKATLPFGDSTIVETIVRAVKAAQVHGVTVVLGANWREVYPVIRHLEITVAVNPRPESGMLSSIQWGLAQTARDVDGYLIVLGDQPQVRTSTIDALLAAASNSDRGIFIPSCSGRRGHPLLIRSRYREAILGLPETVGVNSLVQANPDDVLEVAVEDPRILLDIDTPEDYREASR